VECNDALPQLGRAGRKKVCSLQFAAKPEGRRSTLMNPDQDKKTLVSCDSFRYRRGVLILKLTTCRP
jgi:hypothetical protein